MTKHPKTEKMMKSMMKSMTRIKALRDGRSGDVLGRKRFWEKRAIPILALGSASTA